MFVLVPNSGGLRFMKKILFAASECVPFIKTGGLADVVGSLPKYFNKEEYDVRVIMPKYLCIKESLRSQMKYVTHFYTDFYWRTQYVGVLEMEYEGVHFYFVDSEFYFGGPWPYGNMYEDIEKFCFFSKAVLSILPLIGFKPDIIHCHGWMTALAPLYIKKAYKDEPSFRDAKVVFSVFEDDFKESFNADFVNRLVLKGVTKKDVAHLKTPVDYATLCKLAIDYSDGVIQQSENVNEEVMEYTRQAGKPILEYQTPETFADACNEFYDKVWETEQK